MVFILARKKSARGLLDAVVSSHVVLFAFIAFSTEILSLFGRLTYPGVTGIWSTAFLLLLPCLLGAKNQGTDAPESLRSPLKHLVPGLTALGFSLFATFLTCLIYPPNNWDSMTYHMSRVAHWIDHGNLWFYPTSIERQLYQMPLAEFAILHCQLLSGSDLFANLVQWVCYAVSVGSVALIAEELGLSSRTDQWLSSLTFLTVPMAILQASSTQNDLVVTSFLLTFALFMLRMRTACNWRNGALASISLGLALLTKGTAWVMAPPLGLLLALPILKAAKANPSQLTRRTGLLAMVALLALVINSGHFYRNYKLCGRPMASGSHDYFCRDLSGPAALGNIVRNVALHFGTPSERINAYLYRTLDLALGDQLNNPSNTWITTSFAIPFSRHEDTAGNPIHMLLILFSIALAFPWMRRQPLATNSYVVGTLLAGLCYGVFLKWQPWASRLHTPIFALLAPVVVMAMRQVFGRKGRLFGTIVAALMVAYSVIFAVNNQSRPLWSWPWPSKPRAEWYFVNRPSLYKSYVRVMDLVNRSGAQEVGLYLGVDDGEYPFWAMRSSPIRFRHVWVNNQSKNLQAGAATPSCIIATRDPDAWKEAREYQIEYADDHVRLLMRNGRNHRLHTTGTSATPLCALSGN